MDVNFDHGRVLMVAYYFPPLAAAGSHRSMNFSRELKRLGWDVTVISSSDFKRNQVDEGLLAGMDQGIRVMRAPSPDFVQLLGDWKSGWKRKPGPDAGGKGVPAEVSARGGILDYLSRLLKTPDSMLSFVPCAILRSAAHMLSRRPDVLYSSAPPYSCHLAAYLLKNLFPVPWIADFRDPWADNPFRNNNPYSSLHTLNERMEERVVKEADAVILNTPALEEAFRRRYPSLDHFATISNGFDPGLLESTVRTKGERGSGTEGKLRIVHTGEVYGLRSPRHLISALGDLKRNKNDLFSSLRFEFFGNVHDMEGMQRQMRELEVEGALAFEGQVGHDEALNRCAEADILLLLGVMGSRPEVQVPSKLFEYLALKRPILSLSKPQGAIHNLLQESGVPFLLADLEKSAEIRKVLERMIRGDFDGGDGWGRVGAFAFDHLSRRLAKIMTDLKSGRAPCVT